MNKAIIWILIIFVIGAGIYFFINSNQGQVYAPEQEQLVGADRDEHGCIGSAGYTWCESKQKCLRIWEEDCPDIQALNPVNSYCTENGGIIVSKELPNKEKYEECSFEDNRWCEAVALYNGECPIGGIKITGYDNKAQIYCAITGGEVSMELETCTFSNGVTCGTEDYYNGNCSKYLK